MKLMMFFYRLSFSHYTMTGSISYFKSLIDILNGQPRLDLYKFAKFIYTVQIHARNFNDVK